jgi:hypothetical protein
LSRQTWTPSYLCYLKLLSIAAICSFRPTL